ncbi:MAG: CotH kinase family protein [Acidobacteriota bacterium]
MKQSLAGYRDAKAVAPRTSYARVYATIQGKPKRYLGLYSIVENVDDTFVASHYGVPGGTLFKPVTTRLFNDLGRDWSKYNQSYDPKTTLTDADKQRIFDLSDLVTHSSDEVFAAKLPQFVDLDLFAWRRNRSRGAPISSGRPSPALRSRARFTAERRRRSSRSFVSARRQC